MANALGPYYVQIKYHSLLAPHTMTIPTRDWDANQFDTWSGGPIDDVDMIENLVTEMLPFFDAGVSFDNWQVFRQLLPADDPEPISSGAFTGMTGTDTGGTWAGAVESIITVRTAGFNIAKLDLLDSISDNDFNPIIVPITRITNLIDEWFAVTNGWAGRDNTKPSTFLKMTKNLNQKLRKEYRYD